MKLNENEKNKLINILKEQYIRRNEMFESGELPFLDTEEARKNFIRETEELKEYYETLENTEGEIEFNTDKFELNGKWIWWFMILAIIFNGNTFCDNTPNDSNLIS